MSSPRQAIDIHAMPWRWWLVIGSFSALYGPVYWSAMTGIWQRDDLSHGPIVLAITVWLFWQVRHRIASLQPQPMPLAGWSLLMLALMAYAFGRILLVSSVQLLSALLVVVAILMLLKGISALKVAWFALFYMIFTVPLPGVVIDTLTGPLKLLISQVVVDMLHTLGYPIARAGVTITIDQYQLLVADACSGLNSMFSLAALGTLFMYLMARRSPIHNLVMLVLILPIAFLANIIRVVILVLVTYHIGDGAGQGFLHGAAGIVLMVVALAAFFVADATLAVVLGRLIRQRHATSFSSFAAS